jgi:hypothetical protein
VVGRRGSALRGCLMTILLVVFVVYGGLNAGEAWFKYFRYKDAMAQEARFAVRTTDESILDRLRAKADSLELPSDARRVNIRRFPDGIHMYAEYEDVITVLWMNFDVRFRPQANASF